MCATRVCAIVINKLLEDERTMPTIKQLAAKLNQDATDSLLRNAAAMPADKLEWSPLDAGRTAHNQLAECAVIAKFSVYTLNTRTVPKFDHEAFGKAMAELDTVEKAVAMLKENTDLMVSAIEAFPDEELDTTILMPYSPTPLSFAEVMFGPYWNTVYHIGQFAYIQTLYGDGKMY